MHELTGNAALLLAAYCAVALLASLAGGWIPVMARLTHARLQMAVSVVAGLMLGIALLHLLPDAAGELQSLDRAVAWVLGGFLTMFFVQRFFHFHHHDLPDEDPDDHETPAAESEHVHAPHGHSLAERSARQLSWVGTALGLALHSLLDGLALAAGVAAGTAGHGHIVGLGTALVIVMHKPFDAMAITTLMTASGTSRALRHLLNGLFALVTPLGVALFYVGASRFAESGHVFLGCSLGFVAGSFLCIACSDLLPELQFHSHDRLKLSVALLVGLAVAIFIGQLEQAAHLHEEETPPPATTNRAGPG